jgi:hypothetical protein
MSAQDNLSQNQFVSHMEKLRTEQGNVGTPDTGDSTVAANAL